MAKKGDKIKETDLWANNLCDKYCVHDPNGKEDDKKLFRKCMINPDVKKKLKLKKKNQFTALKKQKIGVLKVVKLYNLIQDKA